MIFAILICSLIVAIGVSMANIALKQLSVSSISRESQIAFYAADSGVECALYWDIQGPYLTPAFYFASTNPNHHSISGVMSCGLSVEGPSFSTGPLGGSDYYVNNFTVHYGNQSPCAVVYVTKNYDGTNVIDSYGINDCSNTDNQYRVERALRVEYK